MLRRSAIHALLILSSLFMAAGLPTFAQSHLQAESVAMAPVRAAAASGATTTEDRDTQNPESVFETIEATCPAARQEPMAGSIQLASFNSLGSEMEPSMEGMTSIEILVGDTVWRVAPSCSGCRTQSFCKAWCMFDNGSPYGFCGPCSPSNPFERRCWCG